jgi:hypothetical protein
LNQIHIETELSHKAPGSSLSVRACQKKRSPRHTPLPADRDDEGEAETRMRSLARSENMIKTSSGALVLINEVEGQMGDDYRCVDENLPL